MQLTRTKTKICEIATMLVTFKYEGFDVKSKSYRATYSFHGFQCRCTGVLEICRLHASDHLHMLSHEGSCFPFCKYASLLFGHFVDICIINQNFENSYTIHTVPQNYNPRHVKIIMSIIDKVQHKLTPKCLPCLDWVSPSKKITYFF